MQIDTAFSIGDTVYMVERRGIRGAGPVSRREVAVVRPFHIAHITFREAGIMYHGDHGYDRNEELLFASRALALGEAQHVNSAMVEAQLKEWEDEDVR